MHKKVFIKRSILPQLIAGLKSPEIMLLVGPRQAGKTSLIRKLQEKCASDNIRTMYLNLDVEREAAVLKTQDSLLERMELEMGKQKRGICFIDEIQRKENAGLFLKGLYDMNLPHKLVVTGSGSLELKEKIHESLVGRKQIFQINPISFWEFANFETNYRYEDRLQDFFKIDKTQSENLLRRYLNFGGYPRVVISDREDEKKQTIDDIFENYLKKDVREIFGVIKTEEFVDLIKILAFQSGKLTNYDEMANVLRLTYTTIKNYLYLLEKTFVLKIVRPLAFNPKTEIVKAPIVYFYDLGLRNFILGLFGKIDFKNDSLNASFLFQNLVLNLLQEEGYKDVRFWRTKNGAEVDFVLNGLTKPMPVEVKFANLKDDNVGRSMISFIEKYSPEEAIIVNLDLEKTRMIGKTRVRFLPFYKLKKGA